MDLSSEGAMMRIGSKKDLVRQLERAIERIEVLERQATRDKRENARLGTLLEGYPAMEIQLQTKIQREDELLIMLQDADKRAAGHLNDLKVKERVIVELKELRLDTSGRDGKIEHLERQLEQARASNRRQQEYIDGQPARAEELGSVQRRCVELEKRCEDLQFQRSHTLRYLDGKIKDAIVVLREALGGEDG